MLAEHPVAQEKGVYDYREGDNLLGLPLRDLTGRQVFAVVASVRPLEIKAEINPLVMEYLRKGTSIHTREWAVDGFEVIVGK